MIVALKEEEKGAPIIDSSSEYVKTYIQKVKEYIYKDIKLQESIMEIVCQPFLKDSLMILGHMKNPEILFGRKATFDYQPP